MVPATDLRDVASGCGASWVASSWSASARTPGCSANLLVIPALASRMSDIKTSPPPAASLAAALPGSERPDYRGKCLYKTGKCVNERALKTSGAAHNLCDEHRNRQNQHQRKLDAKNRLHKRERRASGGAAKTPKNERFAPYPVASTAQRHALPSSVDTSDDDHVASATVVSATPSGAAAAAATSAAERATATTQTTVLATTSSGVMFLPNGPQPPQVSYPFVMQDFDGIVVPLPSYLEGQERVEFRSRIYRKVLDFISEECILRFGARAGGSASVDAATATTVATVVPSAATHATIQAEPQSSQEGAVVASLGASPEDDDGLDTQTESEDVADESRSTGGIASKKVH
ncbi:hypothetical protein PHYSODRAFT_264731 [Phytophthora sojae]|uniref:Uncharacterized protein n=1 Tax=Phytophthora sojae (strain P6497) TaxID=1094619 RepID=G4ZZ53_PHYSP|nr:hypothetical protein PHYSODRAFT_264731 [Phytophthora sojae]EGZ11075.1 hypothetical protein PHYSODRAFT_264731 [Phytophthora sojae]|eukprot:XP_009533820.1 hypothetical protein PHYSODRAFT_264731 [Phytophthora sojae]